MLKQYRETGLIHLNRVDIRNHTPEFGYPWFDAVRTTADGTQLTSFTGHGATKRAAIADLKYFTEMH